MDADVTMNKPIPPPPIQAFTRFINMIPLSVQHGSIYEVFPEVGAEKPPDFFIQHGENFYVLTPPIPDSERILPVNSLMRRLIEAGFREALSRSGCAFKDGKGGYTAYWPTTHTPTAFRDIFHTYKGFEFRIAYYNTGGEDAETEFFLTLDPHTVLVMKASVGDLVRKGIRPSDFCGLPSRVREQSSTEDSGIDCNILSVSDDPGDIRCEVLNFETRETVSVPANQVFIEPKPEVIQDKIISRMNTRFNLNEFVREKTFVSSRQASRERFNATRKVVEFFATSKVTPFSIGETTISIDPNFVPVTGSSIPREDEVPEALLLFDKADSSATHLQPYHGLRTYGPFSKDVPDINLALLGTKAGISLLQQLVNDLNSGTSIMPGGMPRFFRTKLVIVDNEPVADDSTDAYLEAARTLSGRSRDRGSTPDVVLTHLHDRTPPTSLDSPYFAVKPVLLERGLPSQMITPFALRDPQWKHVAIGAALFAKAGGIPWVLAETIEGFDMIVGISVSERISTTKRSGAKPRFVSYANVFDRLGRWMFFESGGAKYDYDYHQQQVAELLAQAVERYKEAQKSYPKSIAIHFYKRFGREEKELIIAAIGAKTPHKQIAFITVDSSHPMRLYDLGIPDGSFPRCHFVHLSDTELLLSATGYTNLSNKRIGTPVFLKLTFDQYPEPFVSGRDIAQQVIALTRLNYKAITPLVGQPVTMGYAALAARFMAAFSEQQWASVANDRIRTVPWFL
jgi:hypothetical protein